MRLSLVQCNRLVVGRLLVTSMAAIVLLVAFLLTIPTEAFGVTHTLKRSSSHQATTVLHTSTTDQDASSLSSSIEDCEDPCTALSQHMIQILPRYVTDAQTYATSMDLPLACQSIFQFFTALKSQQQDVLGMTGRPFCIRNHQWPSHCDGFFTIADLEQAVMDDFLDAARGSTDNRKGWTITDVSQPRGQSFEEARMTFEDVQAALEKGTVIFNAAGAHIPKLAGPSLATTDATDLPCALNLYVTAPNQRTSAPPHTDKQDVVVVQTSGCKHWKVFQPPNPALKPSADVFSRGKQLDNLPLYSLEEQGTLLIETTLYPGDVLFVPAGFPHTTSTVQSNDKDTTNTIHLNKDEQSQHASDTSIHLTLGIDHHIWELDYLNARRLALRRAGVKDTALGQTSDQDNPFVGKVNELPEPTRSALLSELPLGLLSEDESISQAMMEQASAELERLALAVDETTAKAATEAIPTIWKDTIVRIRQQGVELLETHRDMYLAAIEEGQAREAEDAMTAHLNKAKRRTLTPERMQRLSLFRVKRYYDRINESKEALKAWSYEGVVKDAAVADRAVGGALPDNWAYTLPINVGDQVEADLGGAFFPATVQRITPEGKYDVQFFDGDVEQGLDREMIKLTTPPTVAGAAGAIDGEDDVDTSNMTAKQLKRWKKQQAKKQKLKK